MAIQNIEVKDGKDKITLVIDKKVSLGPSKSGKTIMVATTGGNQELKDGIFLGLNCYKYPPR